MSDAAQLKTCHIIYNNKSWTYPEVPVSDRQFLVSGLTSNTSYTFMVRCQEEHEDRWLCSQQMVVRTTEFQTPRYSHLKQELPNSGLSLVIPVLNDCILEFGILLF